MGFFRTILLCIVGIGAVTTGIGVSRLDDPGQLSDAAQQTVYGAAGAIAGLIVLIMSYRRRNTRN